MDSYNKPNIILIMTDEMRGDCLGIAGHPDAKTPWLDSIAATGVRFEHAYSATPSCIAARAALHTGMSQDHHHRVGYQDGVRWDYEHTMAGEIAKAGYHTECIGKMHVHPLRNSMGYHHIELHDGYLHYYRRPDRPVYEDQRNADDYFHFLKDQLGVSADITDTGVDCNSWVTRPWCYDERLHPTRWVTDRTLDFLRRRDHDQPFFLTVSYVRPHAPYDPPQAFYDMYKDRPLAETPVGDWADPDTYLKAGRYAASYTAPADPELLNMSKAGYYGCISQVDYEIGRLYMELIEEGLLDNTVILFTSDHGDMMGDHHFVRKSLPYEGSAHIPMILAGPSRYVPAEPGSTIDKVVELRDIMPTFLDLIGAEIPDTVDGTSLLADTEREYIHGEHTNGAKSNQFLVTKQDKYIWFSQTGEEQYFDLVSDPKELHNAIREPEAQERIAHLRSCLIRELTGREEGFTDGSSLIPGRPLVEVLHRDQHS